MKPTIKIAVEKDKFDTYWGTILDIPEIFGANGTGLSELKNKLQTKFSKVLKTAKENGDRWCDDYDDGYEIEVICTNFESE